MKLLIGLVLSACPAAINLLLGLVLSAYAAAVGVQSPPPSTAMASLIDTERAFARMSVAEGRRAAFLAFFGEDAIFFSPAPATAKPAVRKWPAAGPFRLDWEPHFGDVAEAGDLGYTTGPFLRTSPDAAAKVVGSGWFFTIWRRQPDGTWKVAIDTGIVSPASVPLRPGPAPTGYVVAPHATSGPAASSVTSADARQPVPLSTADRSFCQAVSKEGWPAALRAAGDSATRVYRDGVAPVTGADSQWSAGIPQGGQGRMSCATAKAETSSSGDFGYAYGTYSVDGPSAQSGYYLRVWRRHGGAWKIAADLLISGS